MEKHLIGSFLNRIKRPIDLDDNKEYKLVTIRINHKGVTLRELKTGDKIKSKMYIVKEGDFILSGIDARHGAFGIVPKELDGAIVTNDFWYFDVNEDVISKKLFLELTATSWFDTICKRGSDGTTQRVRLQKDKFFNQKIVLPSREEQEGLLKNLLISKEKQLALKKEIQLQKSLLKNLKQSILQEAIEGHLTKEWRLENPKTENASTLLERIKNEKKQLIADKKIKKENPLPKIQDNEIPFEIPKNWVWCRLGEICHLITKGSSPKWQGINYIENEEILFVTSENIGTNKMLLEKKKYLEMRFNDIQPRSILVKGDILTNIVGGSIGRTAIWNEDFVANINQAVCLIRLPDEYMNKQYLINILNSDFGINLMTENKFDTGRGNLSLSSVSNFAIAFPPLSEQKAIVEKVEKLMRFCSELGEEIEKSESHADLLMQSVLKEAFEVA